MFHDQPTPFLSVDKAVMTANISRMAKFAAARGLSLRPHAKTHKNWDIARLQVQSGAVGLTVATVGEAEIFARGGFGDLFIAYPLWVDEAKAARIAALLSTTTQLTIGVDSIEGAARLGKFLSGVEGSDRLKVRVEIDSGHHRSGIIPERAGDVARAAQEAGLDVEGIFTFPGHGYGLDRTREQAAEDELRALTIARDALLTSGINCKVVSGGSTPTAALVNPQLSGTDPVIDELRPGVYVFNDAQQWEVGSCSNEDIALTAVATIVSIRGNRLVVDAGSKILGADRSPWATGYGRLLDYPDARVVALSEHHATIEFPDEFNPREPFHLGDRLKLVPNHVCNAVNLVDHFLVGTNGVDEQRFEEQWHVHARGANT